MKLNAVVVFPACSGLPTCSPPAHHRESFAFTGHAASIRKFISAQPGWPIYSGEVYGDRIYNGQHMVGLGRYGAEMVTAWHRFGIRHNNPSRSNSGKRSSRSLKSKGCKFSSVSKKYLKNEIFTNYRQNSIMEIASIARLYLFLNLNFNKGVFFLVNHKFISVCRSRREKLSHHYVLTRQSRPQRQWRGEPTHTHISVRCRSNRHTMEQNSSRPIYFWPVGFASCSEQTASATYGALPPKGAHAPHTRT